VIFSLGSTTTVATIVSGITLIYTRVFEIGYRINIGEAIGNVEETTLIVWLALIQTCTKISKTVITKLELKTVSHYAAIRNGHQTTIPESYMAKDYTSQSFRLQRVNSLFSSNNNVH